eukprot:TRINITY_DN67697_c0_g1_i1.p1 TRINITY_DN67697_c0_g1~~TRINITY_DN67697_c0_g1_i1.p1  ORF type:complete len:171 (+),score=48.11 TRINITY_DN67697_c0_g1_i1:55-567(+)
MHAADGEDSDGDVFNTVRQVMTKSREAKRRKLEDAEQRALTNVDTLVEQAKGLLRTVYSVRKNEQPQLKEARAHLAKCAEDTGTLHKRYISDIAAQVRAREKLDQKIQREHRNLKDQYQRLKQTEERILTELRQNVGQELSSMSEEIRKLKEQKMRARLLLKELANQDEV